MPSYHSKYEEIKFEETCSCAICPLKTELKGPAEKIQKGSDYEDIIDETLQYFRANVLFRNFDVRSSADRTLIYLTLFAHQCLVKAEKIEEKSTALKDLRALATKQFVTPGDSGWPLGTLFPVAKDKAEGDTFKTYFKQAREELSIRICDLLFNADGSKNKWWQSFSKRKFMGKELKD